MFCTSCANELPIGVANCPKCGVATEGASSSASVLGLASPSRAAQSRSPLFDTLKRRYADAYKAARFIVGLGMAIKVISVIIAIGAGMILAIGIIGIISAASEARGGGAAAAVGFSFVIGFWGLLFAFALIGYVLGVLVSA